MVAFKNNKQQPCGELLKSVHQHNSIDNQGSAVWDGPCANWPPLFLVRPVLLSGLYVVPCLHPQHRRTPGEMLSKCNNSMSYLHLKTTVASLILAGART